MLPSIYLRNTTKVSFNSFIRIAKIWQSYWEFPRKPLSSTAEPSPHTDPSPNVPKDVGDSNSTPWQRKWLLQSWTWFNSGPHNHAVKYPLTKQEIAVFRVILQLLLLGDVPGTPSNPHSMKMITEGDFFQRVVCSREKQATPHFYQKNQWHASKCKKEVPFLLWLRFLKQMHSDNGLKTSTFPGIEQATPMKCMCKLWWQIETKTRAEAPLSFSPSQTKAMSTAGLSWTKQSWQQTALLFCTES